MPSSTDTEEASYRRKLLLQMSDPPNRRITSCFSPLELDNITAALSMIATTPTGSYIYLTVEAGVLHKHHILVGLKSTSKWITGWMRPALN